MLKDNPDAMKQVEGFWKFLDNLHESSPEEYKQFIDNQMKDMKEDLGQEQKEEIKKQTIKSKPAFCMKVLVARKVDQSKK